MIINKYSSIAKPLLKNNWYFVLHSTKLVTSLCCQCKTCYKIDSKKVAEKSKTILNKKIKILVMKTQTTNFLNQLNSNELNNLTADVKEILATDVHSNKSTLKAIDFWNLQRLQKSRTCGRFPSISVR